MTPNEMTFKASDSPKMSKDQDKQDLEQSPLHERMEKPSEAEQIQEDVRAILKSAAGGVPSDADNTSFYSKLDESNIEKIDKIAIEIEKKVEGGEEEQSSPVPIRNDAYDKEKLDLIRLRENQKAKVEGDNKDLLAELGLNESNSVTQSQILKPRPSEQTKEEKPKISPLDEDFWPGVPKKAA